MVKPPICGDRVCFQSKLGTVYEELIAFWCNGPLGESLGGKLSSKDDRFRFASNTCSYMDLKGLLRLFDGKHPLERVDSSKIKPLETGVRDRLEAFLQRPMASVDNLTISVWDITKRFHDMGYDMWVAGGAARDFLRGRTTANDVDLAGTVPPGVFAEVVYQLIRDFDLDLGMNPPAQVIYIYDRQKPRIAKSRRALEYAPLKHQYIKIPVRYEFDHDTERDSMHRDLTINSLLCDIFRGVVIDPTGRGLDDLSTLKLRVISPVPADCPEGTLASRVLRLLKFVVRWEDADLGPVQDFFNAHLEAFGADFGNLYPERKLDIVAKAFFGSEKLGDPGQLREACSKLQLHRIYETHFDSLWNGLI
jgi:hypothetical protein